MDSDMRSRVVRLEQAQADHGHRILTLEAHRVDQKIADARKDEQLRGIVEKLDKIDKNMSWVVKLVIGGMITAALAFVVGGGFRPS